MAELAAQKNTEKALLGESDQVGAKFQGQLPSEPSYDLLKDADQKIEKLQEQVNAFEFLDIFGPATAVETASEGSRSHSRRLAPTQSIGSGMKQKPTAS